MAQSLPQQSIFPLVRTRPVRPGADWQDYDRKGAEAPPPAQDAEAAAVRQLLLRWQQDRGGF